MLLLFLGLFVLLLVVVLSARPGAENRVGEEVLRAARERIVAPHEAHQHVPREVHRHRLDVRLLACVCVGGVCVCRRVCSACPPARPRTLAAEKQSWVGPSRLDYEGDRKQGRSLLKHDDAKQPARERKKKAPRFAGRHRPASG